MSQTMYDYFEKLKPVQQEFIVWCVKNYSDRGDFHRGLLPFLPVDEAIRCLKHRMEDVKLMGSVVLPPTGGMIGHRFVGAIISAIRNGSTMKLFENEVTVTRALSDRKLAARFGKRYSTSFILQSRNPDHITQLDRVRPNLWHITAHPDHINDAVLQLLNSKLHT